MGWTPGGDGVEQTGSALGGLGTCAAPATSMRFEPDGRVLVCCINSQYSLGEVPARTLSEIWQGARRRQLQDAIAVGDFSLGCTACRDAHLSGRRSETEAREFDRLVTAGVGVWPRRLEFALSNTCNLECVHCNGELSSAIRARREHRPPLVSPYDDEFFDQLDAFLPHATEVAFLGGEPFLSRRSRRVWDRLIELGSRAEVHVTTNGTVLDDRVEHYLRALSMNVTVSVDGFSADTFEAIRIGAKRDDVYANVQRLAAIAAEYGGALGLNVCVMRDNWTELADVLEWAEHVGATARCIPVTFPTSLSLVELPAPELREVVQELDRRDHEVRARLDRTLPAWDRLRQQLGAALEQRSSQVEVRPRGSGPDAAVTPWSEFEQLVLEQAGALGCTPVRLAGHDDVITAVTDQDWARPYRFPEMSGESLLRLLPGLARRLGADPRVEVSDLGNGVVHTRVHLVHERWTRELTSVMSEHHDGERRRFRIAVMAPAGEAPPDTR